MNLPSTKPSHVPYQGASKWKQPLKCKRSTSHGLLDSALEPRTWAKGCPGRAPVAGPPTTVAAVAAGRGGGAALGAARHLPAAGGRRRGPRGRPGPIGPFGGGHPITRPMLLGCRFTQLRRAGLIEAAVCGRAAVFLSSFGVCAPLFRSTLRLCPIVDVSDYVSVSWKAIPIMNLELIE